MKIIISPAKTMVQRETAVIPFEIKMGQPVFQKEAEWLMGLLDGFSQEALKALFKVSDSLALKTLEQIERFAETPPVPGLFAFQGAVYKALSVKDFTWESLLFSQENLLILSTLYGVVKPFDAVVPYRLDLTTGLKPDGNGSLGKFWKPLINAWVDGLLKPDEPILNLASDEYATLLTKGNLSPRVISLQFLEKSKGKLRTVAMHSKQARGFFLKKILQQELEAPEAIKLFHIGGYSYQKELSTDQQWVFVRE